jgi:Ribbon-helix-helix protein, copG family
MYGVRMERVNIYLDEDQLEALRALSERRDEPVAALVRLAVDEWLGQQGVRRLSPDEWSKRFDALLRRRSRIARDRGFTETDVERDVAAAVRESRKARAARRP